MLASVFGLRYGVRVGLRIMPLVSLPAAALLQFVAVDAANAYVAVAALALCFAAVELNEGPYWAAIMHVGRADSMAASGLLNTGGNAGGLIATPIVAYLSGHNAVDARLPDRRGVRARECRRLAAGGSDTRRHRGLKHTETGPPDNSG